MTYLLKPVTWYDFQATSISNNLNVCMWEVFIIFICVYTDESNLNNILPEEPERYHEWHVKEMLEILGKQEIWNNFEDAELEKRRIVAARAKKTRDANPRKTVNKNEKDMFDGNNRIFDDEDEVDDKHEEDKKDNIGKSLYWFLIIINYLNH